MIKHFRLITGNQRGLYLCGIGKHEARCGERNAQGGGAPSQVMTIGHSTHTLEEFIRMLQAHGVTYVVDVRTIPRSRHNAQFNKESLPLSLKKAGIGYIHIPALGGLRHAGPRRIDQPGQSGPNRFNVRRSASVALSSLAHRRRLTGSWNSYREHHERNSPSGS